MTDSTNRRTERPSDAAPTLTPPSPRIQPPRRTGARAPAAPDPLVISPAAPREAEGGHRGLLWLTVAFFAVLAVAAVAVFVVLPDWVQARQELTPPSPAAGLPAVAPAADPAAADSADRATPLDAPEAARREVELDAPPEPEPPAPRDEPFQAAAAPAPAAPPRPSTATVSQPSRPRPDDGFAQAMSEGLAALDRGDYAAAREAFARASGLRPGSTQSADGLARADTGLRLAAITELRAAAAAFEAEEDWHAAAQRYTATLELDPTIEFAQDGLARSRSRAALADQLDFHTARPERLASDAVLEEAAVILAEASEVDPPGPRLKRQIATLAPLIEAYSTPVRAVLESDELTEVTVYKVGRLGTFRRHALDLRPGTYTVVGSRRGYRDVRRQLVIAPGAAPATLAVRCEDEI